jgi:ATP-dependent Lhr-like helicase
MAQAFDAPTEAQRLAWPVIATGHNTLVFSPTGSGKTLAAFLWAINELVELASRGELPATPYVVYVSPLRALANDIEKNLLRPLEEMRERAEEQGVPFPDIRVGVRTGDTLVQDRRRMLRRPPQILITTPESLYLLLTSSFREHLRAVRYVIVDEIHYLCGDKRGAHLAVTLERLEELLREGGQAEAGTDSRPSPLVRIGLSATQSPVKEIARFLVGSENEGEARDCTIVDLGVRRDIDLQVIAPVPNLAEAKPEDVWEAIYEQLLDLIVSHRTTLVFCNTRHLTERVAAKLNMLAEEREVEVRIGAHHGSMSRALRLEMEEELKSGALRAIVATSSLELGIDIGHLDLVCQVESPKSVAAGLQRVGRAGHLLGLTSKGRLFTTSRDDLVEMAVIAREMLAGRLDPVHIPCNCLDVAAQQTAAMAAVETDSAAHILRVLRRAYNFRQLGDDDFAGLLRQLSGRFEDRELFELPARVHWDDGSGRVSATQGAAGVVRQNVGTIPEYAEYAVHAEDYGKKLGALDERFVQRLGPAQIFVLGTRAWEFLRVERNRVYVRDGRGRSPTIPRWAGPDYIPRSYRLGKRVGDFRSAVFKRLFTRSAALRGWLMRQCRLDESGAQQVVEYFVEEAHSLDTWPGADNIVVEDSRNPLGHRQLVCHSAYGAAVNEAWAEALVQAARRELGLEVQAAYDDDAFGLHLPGDCTVPAEEIMSLVTSSSLQGWVDSYVRASALFTIRFRHVAVRALAVSRMAGGQRRPVWQQEAAARRLEREVDTLDRLPLIAETVRECVEDHLDLGGLRQVLGQLESGQLRLVCSESRVPSPFSHELLLGAQFGPLGEAARRERRAELLSLHREILQQILDEESIRELLSPKVVRDLEGRRQGTSRRHRARDREELLRLMRRCGELADDQNSDLFMGERASDGWRGWLDKLSAEGRAVAITLPKAADPRRWIAAEDAAIYARAFGDDIFEGGGTAPEHSVSALPRRKPGRAAARRQVILRALRALGPVPLVDLASRYGLTKRATLSLLRPLLETGELQQGDFVADRKAPQVCTRANLEELHRMALATLRREVAPVDLDHYADFLLRWQHVRRRKGRQAPDLTAAVMRQLAGHRAYPTVWERELLGARTEDKAASLLLNRVSAGGSLMGQFSLGETGPRPVLGGLTFVGRENARRLVEVPSTEGCSSEELRVVSCLREGGGTRLADLASAIGLPTEAIEIIVWRLFSRGLASNTDYSSVSRCRWTSTPQSVRQLLGHPGGEAEHSGAGQAKAAAALRRAGLHADRGHWYAVNEVADTAVDEAAARGRCRARVLTLMERYGVAAREVLLAKSGLSTRELARGLRELFLRGQLLRGFFVRELSGDQFALPAALEQMRSEKPGRADPAVMINSLDPAAVHLSVVKPAGLADRALATRYLVLRRGQLLAVIDRHPGEGRFLRVRDLRLAHTDASSRRRAKVLEQVGSALLEYAVRWSAWEAVRVGRVDRQPVWKQDDVVQVLTAQGFRLVRDEMVYRLRKRVRAAAAPGMRRVVRTEEQRKEDIRLTSKAVLDFHTYIVTEYEPPPDKDMLAIFQCSVSRPFSKSPSHASMRKAVRLATGKDPKADFEDCRCHVVVLSSVIGPVPYELETTYPADERGGGVKHMSPQDYHLARPVLAERMAAYLRRWHDRYKVITTFTHGRYGEVMRAARELAELDFSILPDPSGPRLRGGNQYWTRDWIQIFFELLEAMTEEERGEARARLAAESVELDAR